MTEPNTTPQAPEPQVPASPQEQPQVPSQVQPDAQAQVGAQAETQAQPQADAQAQPQAQPEVQANAQAQAAQAFGQPYAQQAQQPYACPPYPYGYAYAQPGPVPAPAAPQKKSKVGWIIAGVAVAVAVLLFVSGVRACTAAVESFGAMDLESMDSSYVETDGASVAVIDIAGTIQYDGTSCSPEGLADLLDQAEENPDIKAVVLRVDSGGGTATAGEEMAAYVRDFSKPIVVSSASMNCSAAYEFSSQADYIFVNETTAIGAIGTVMQVTDLSGLLDMLGISVDNIASADSKDSSYGTRPLTEEERAYYQDLVDTINETFIKNVAEGRNMKVSEVRKLATGMEFAGKTAVENGLADEIGIYDDALDKAAKMGGIKGKAYDVVSLTDYYYDMSDLMYLLGAESASDMTVEDLLNLLEEEGISA